MKKENRINLYLTDEMEKLIEQKAKENEMTKSCFIRFILQKSLKQEKQII